MANEERSSLESKKALDKVESNLGEARRLYSGEQQDSEKAKDHAASAREACGEMAKYLSDSLTPLVTPAVDSVEEEKPVRQVEIQIDSALAEVDRLRLSLGSVQE